MSGFGTLHPTDFAPGSIVTDPTGDGQPQIVTAVNPNDLDTTDAPQPVGQVPNINQPVAQANGTHSGQMVPADLTVGVDAGKDSPDTAFIAPIMGNIHGDSLTKTGNYLGGVIGEDSITGAQATLVAKGGIIGIVADGVSVSDGAVLAILDGDGGGATTPLAMFKAIKLNSTGGNNPQYGLDLLSAVAGFLALVPSKADIRCANDLCFLQGAGAPTNGVTGANFAGTGSQYVNTTAGDSYINAGSKAVPAWKAITHA
jgi:hypothetical protein